MFNFKYLVGGAALVLATSALAGGPEVAPEPASHSGFYVSGHGGASLLSTSNPYWSAGYDLGGALGYRWDNIRLELEGTYVRHTVRTFYQNAALFTVNGPVGGTGVSGFSPSETLTVFGNLLYDFDFGSRFVPYVGIGLGWENDWASLTITGNANNTFNRTWDLDGNDVTVQGILGVDFKVTDAVAIGINYNAVLASPPDFGRLVNNAIINNNVFSRANTLDSQFNLSVTFFF